MTADPITKCFVCDGEVKRLIGAGAGPIFKGSGFYHTDYKNLSKKTNTSSSSSKKDEQKKTSETKKDKSKDK
jgi:predicted nucleic acid-binding Zn ribbon protein